MTAATPVQTRPLTVAAAAMAVQPDDFIIERARGKYVYAWWLTDDPYLLADCQLKEPVLLVEFGRLREAVELVLGRDVQPFEFTHPEKLLEEIRGLVG